MAQSKQQENPPEGKPQGTTSHEGSQENIFLNTSKTSKTAVVESLQVVEFLSIWLFMIDIMFFFLIQNNTT